MPDYDNTNRGVLFKNDRKEKETHPDRTGSINIEGKEYWLNGWIKEARDGSPFLSLSVKPKDEQGGGERRHQGSQGGYQQRTPAHSSNQRHEYEDDGDSVPF